MDFRIPATVSFIFIKDYSYWNDVMLILDVTVLAKQVHVE